MKRRGCFFQREAKEGGRHMHKQSSALKQANEELGKQFQVDGYPTLVVLNSSGKEIGRQVGYAPGGPDAFIAKLERFNQTH